MSKGETLAVELFMSAWRDDVKRAPVALVDLIEYVRGLETILPLPEPPEAKP